MHIWIDIDKAYEVPLIKALSQEILSRGHFLYITAQNSSNIIKALGENNLNAEIIGGYISFFGIFSHWSNLFRASLLSAYIENQKIDIAFSLGSTPMVYSSTNQEISIILLIESYNEKANWLFFQLEKSYFLIPELVSEEQFLEKGININRIAKYTGVIQKNNPDPSLKAIKDIANKIEALSKVIPGKLLA